MFHASFLKAVAICSNGGGEFGRNTKDSMSVELLGQLRF